MLQCLSGLVQTKPKQCWQCDPQTRLSLPFSVIFLTSPHCTTCIHIRWTTWKQTKITQYRAKPDECVQWVTSYTFPKMNGFHNHFAHLHGHLQMCSIKSTILEKGPVTIRCDPQSYSFPTRASLSKNLQQIGLRDSSSAKNLTIPIWNLSISL